MATQKLRVIIKNTESTLFDGDAERVSSFNEVGRFDILPMHANFISMINKKLTIFQNHQIVKELDIQQAVLKVKRDVVRVFIGIETFDFSEVTTSNLNK